MSLNPSNSISERTTGKPPFENMAGVGRRDPQRADSALAAELRAAGIKVVELSERYGEPQSLITGELYGWQFRRAWYYWMAVGPGIPFESAMKLHATHGKSVRVNGHCGCPPPSDYGAEPIRAYHVDNQDGLNALAATIRALSVEVGVVSVEVGVVSVPVKALKLAHMALQTQIIRMRKDLSETPGYEQGAAQVVGKMIQEDVDADQAIQKALAASVLPST